MLSTRSIGFDQSGRETMEEHLSRRKFIKLAAAVGGATIGGFDLAHAPGSRRRKPRRHRFKASRSWTARCCSMKHPGKRSPSIGATSFIESLRRCSDRAPFRMLSRWCSTRTSTRSKSLSRDKVTHRMAKPKPRQVSLLIRAPSVPCTRPPRRAWMRSLARSGGR